MPAPFLLMVIEIGARYNGSEVCVYFRSGDPVPLDFAECPPSPTYNENSFVIVWCVPHSDAARSKGKSRFVHRASPGFITYAASLFQIIWFA